MVRGLRGCEAPTQWPSGPAGAGSGPDGRRGQPGGALPWRRGGSPASGAGEQVVGRGAGWGKGRKGPLGLAGQAPLLLLLLLQVSAVWDPASSLSLCPCHLPLPASVSLMVTGRTRGWVYSHIIPPWGLDLSLMPSQDPVHQGSDLQEPSDSNPYTQSSPGPGQAREDRPAGALPLAHLSAVCGRLG